LVGSGHGDGSSALGDGAFFAVGLGKGGGGLDARRATRGNRLGYRGSGHGGPWAGANLRASCGQDDYVIVVGARCLHEAAGGDRGRQGTGGELGRPTDDRAAGRL
jgi:hypothetical protein